ncbi:hypothetical protein LXL04_039491 [Taraxacum kok-saghyz]
MNWKAIDEVTTRFYVNNFPPATTSKDLWLLFVNFGKLVDVYIPDQLSKYGKRFAFVRYLGLKNDKDKQEIVNSIRTIWIGNYHVILINHRSIDRSQKNTETSKKPTEKQEQQNGVKTFASVVKGNEGVQEVEKNIQQVFALPNDTLIQIGSQQLKRFVKIKDPNLISKFNQVCSEEDFDLGINYIGGRWIIIEFPIMSAMKGFKNNATVRNMIMEVKEIIEEFLVDERLIWAEIRGLPACAWVDKAIIMMAEKWEEFLFWEESAQYTLASRSFCIAIKSNRLLQETCKEWEADLREENPSTYGEEDREDDETKNGSEYHEEEDEEGEINNKADSEKEGKNIDSGSNQEEQGMEVNQ